MNENQNDDDSRDETFTKSGRVRFDDRGNAVWEPWSARRLDHPALKLADEPAVIAENSVENPRGLINGYNPYHSGMLAGDKQHKKKDLRALSKWIELQKALKQKSGE